MFCHHLVALCKKLSLHVTLLRRLVGSGWNTGTKTLCIATLYLVYLTAEYCAPVWCSSAHTCLIDSVLNNALCIVTGCLHPTPMDELPILSGIQPAELCQMETTLSLAHRGSLDLDHILYVLKWVLRCLQKETIIQTPVCASCVESFGQPCQTWHQRF